MSKASRSNQLAAGNTLDDARHRRVLVGLDLDADALVLAQRQQVVDDVEALRALGIVDAADVDQHLEPAARSSRSAVSTCTISVAPARQRSARRSATVDSAVDRAGRQRRSRCASASRPSSR